MGLFVTTLLGALLLCSAIIIDADNQNPPTAGAVAWG